MRSSLASTLLRSVIPALAVLAAATPAHADETLPPRDYDAPDPERTGITHLRAAAAVTFVNFILWQYDWILDKQTIYRITGTDVVNNHTGGIPFDSDKLDANFLGHSVDGAMYLGAARATGLGFWETAPYVFGGSLMWEMFSENQKPSANDLIVTPVAGMAIGEVLYRLSSVALDDSRSGLVRLKDELVGFAISPTRGVTRAVTGEAWADGAPPIEKHARIVAHGGLDRVTAGSVTKGGNNFPCLMLAVDAEYGDLLPAASKRTIPAYDFFDLYAGGVITSQRTSGFEMSTLGLLHGWSTDISDDEGPSRDNNVLGVVQSFDYQGTNLIEFGGIGIGLGDFVVVRRGPRDRLRLGVDVGWAPLAGMSSEVNPYAGSTELRNYNFSTGPTLGVGVRWDLGRAGQLGLWAREYATRVIEGIPGQELFGYARLWYEVEAIRDVFGVGMAPKLMHRLGTYTQGRTDQATQLALQFYATLRL